MFFDETPDFHKIHRCLRSKENSATPLGLERFQFPQMSTSISSEQLLHHGTM